MKIDFWTLALQAINALVLIWLLSRVLYRPVVRAIAQRREAATKLLADAEAERERARQAGKAVAAQQAELAAGRDAALKAAQDDAAQARARLLAAAQAEVDSLRKQAQDERDEERLARQRANEQRAAALAVDITARLLARLPASARVAGFLDDLVASLRALPDAQRQKLAASAVPLQIVAPRALDPDEMDRCTQAIQQALGRSAALQPVVDPNLIAGLELRSSDLVVSNHLRADLAQLLHELNHADGHA
jgi:F-type H+-transporting ATPase subunit b